MARKRRWYQQSSSFASGILSEATQDNIDTAIWDAGLAQAENVALLRDGGLQTRPPLKRLPEALPRLTHSALASWSLLNGHTATDSGDRTITAGALPPSGEDGIVPFDVRIRPRVGQDFLRIDFASGETHPRAVHFHGTRLLRGNAVVAGKLAFEVDGVSDEDTDPYHETAFAPGLVSRTLTVRLDTTDGPMAASLTLGASSGAGATDLVFSGLSAPLLPPPRPGNDQPLLQRAWDALWGPRAVSLPRQHRIIPWTVGQSRLALVFGLASVTVFGIGEDGSWRNLGTTPADATRAGIWTCTPRQLREMSWSVFRRSLLLFHTDWPRPWEVSFNTQGALQIQGLVLTNIAQVPDDVARSARGELRIGDRIQIVRSAGAAPPPLSLRASPSSTAGNAFDLSWASTPDAESYEIVWDTAATYDAGPSAWTNARASNVAFADLPGNKRAVGVTNATVSGLTAATEYVFSVRAIYPSAVRSDFAAVVRGSAYPLPTKVAGLTATAPTTLAVTERRLSWTAVAHAARYDLQVRETGMTAWTDLTDKPTTNTVDVTVDDETLGYDFRVRAVLPNGLVGEYSDPASVAGLPEQQEPTSVRVERSTGVANRLDVYWTNPPTFARIQVAYREAGTTGDGTIETATAGRTVHSFDLTNAQAYEFRVRAVSARGVRSDWTAWTDSITALNLAPRGASPQISTGPLLGQVFVRQTLSASDRPLSWEIQYRSGTQSFSDTRQITVVLSEAIASDVTPVVISRAISGSVGQTMFVRTRFVRDNAAPGAWSAPVSAVVARSDQTPAAPQVASTGTITLPGVGRTLRVVWRIPALGDGIRFQLRTRFRNPTGPWSAFGPTPAANEALQDGENTVRADVAWPQSSQPSGRVEVEMRAQTTLTGTGGVTILSSMTTTRFIPV